MRWRLGCIAQTIFADLISDGWGAVFSVLIILYFISWTLSIRERQGPYEIAPLAPGLMFDERQIVRRVQERLRIAQLDPVLHDTIVRSETEIRRRSNWATLCLRKATPSQRRSELLHLFAMSSPQAAAKLSPRQRSVNARETIDYVDEVWKRARNVYPWTRKRQEQANSDPDDPALPEADID
jgi:hypothetical protein